MSKNSRGVVDYRRRTKQRGLTYKGSVCIVCGYNRSVRSLHFHHLDPNEKDMGVSSGNTIAWKRLKKELDKCVLLCSNCHGEVHDDLLDLTPHLHKNPSPEEGQRMIEEADLEIQNQKKQRPRCMVCQSEIYRRSSRCKKCAGLSRVGKKTKIDWPSLETLLKRVETTSYLQVGKQLGVSDNAVRKRIRNQKRLREHSDSDGE